ncbi:MAG: DUF3488 domain-containing protein [Rhodocyclales bacterium GT-UBC]|nr:MAG: DUF3488 domain-containing protein [Rhodocyclales bacterium GT-UBC]
MSTPAKQALDHGCPPWLIASALLTIAPHFEHQPLWLSAFSAALLVWATWLWHQDQRLPGRWPMIALVGLACSGIFVEYRTLFGRDAGVGMLVIFMAMKLLELRSRRDANIITILGYFLLLTHYLYSQSIPTGLWLIAALWIVTAAQIRVNGGPLCRIRETLRYAAMICLQGIPFMLVLFVLFPRISGPLWGLPEDAHAGRTGLSDSMTPGSIASLAQSAEIAFRVRFADPLPATAKLYWRGPVLDNFDGRAWRSSAGAIPRETLTFDSAPIRYETTLEANNQRWLLALDAPSTLPPDSSLDGRLTAQGRLPITQRQRVQLASSLDYRLNVEESPKILHQNLALPARFNPQARSLAASWRAETQTPQAIIDKALELFASERFAYTLEPPLLGENSIDEFLFQTRRGFCEHYAAAFVVLMRAAGIPARVVGGYLGGEQNPLDGYWVIRQSDAHAWAEVWLEGRGWRRIDPTAVVAPARVDSGISDALPAGEPLPALVQMRGTWLRNLRHRWEALNNAWNQQILGYDPQRQRELLAKLGLPDSDWRSMATMLGGLGTLLMASMLAWTLYQHPKHDPATRLWHTALRHLARRQVHCAPGETPLALLRRIEKTDPKLAQQLNRVVECYLLTRYGDAGDALNPLRDAVAQLTRWR